MSPLVVMSTLRDSITRFLLVCNKNYYIWRFYNMPIMDLGSFQTLLDRRYREIKDMEMSSVTDQIPLWFSEETSESFEERRSTIGELPTWDTFTGNLEYARFYEQYNAAATHIEFTQGLRW